MNLIDFHSHLWETYTGAYGNVKDDIVILTNEKQLFYKKNECSEYHIAFDNLFENLSHQMSFYNATYIALPYIIKLLEEYQNHFWEQSCDWSSDVCSSDLKSYYFRYHRTKYIRQLYRKYCHITTKNKRISF